MYVCYLLITEIKHAVCKSQILYFIAVFLNNMINIIRIIFIIIVNYYSAWELRASSRVFQRILFFAVYVQDA